jgi:hypothetical protein
MRVGSRYRSSTSADSGGSQSVPRVQGADGTGLELTRPPNRRVQAVDGRGFESGCPKPSRPVSIALTTIRSRSSWRTMNLPRRETDSRTWPMSASCSPGVPRRTSVSAASERSTGRPTRAAWKASVRMAMSGSSGTRRAAPLRCGRSKLRGSMRGPFRGQAPRDARADLRRRSLTSPKGHGRPTSDGRRPEHVARAFSRPGGRSVRRRSPH